MSGFEYFQPEVVLILLCNTPRRDDAMAHGTLLRGLAVRHVRVSLVAWVLGGCSSSPASPPDVGQAQITLASVPGDVACVAITASGSRTVAKSLEARSGETASLVIGGLPLGAVTFTAVAFAEICSAVLPEHVATWVSDAQVVTLEKGVIASVTLVMHRNGLASVSVDFADDGGGSGGQVGTGGVVGSGGRAGTGGTGSGGMGTGGVAPACTGASTQCSGNGVQTCANGQWGAPVACGTRQTCTGPTGSAKCSCTPDPACGAVGATCADVSTLVTCMMDAQTCLYQSSSSTCAGGMCSGAAGAASCCTNACTMGVTQCAGLSLTTCSAAANGCTALSTSACGTGLLCERYSTPACVDPTWAEWPMPNGPVDVAAGAPNAEAYTDNGDGTVTDNVTELMWQQAAAPATYTWAAAVAYCPTLTLAGHKDWRLPSRIELVSILDVGVSGSAIDPTYFPGTPVTAFWSSSPWVGNAPGAWFVFFGHGNTSPWPVANTLAVRCVR